MSKAQKFLKDANAGDKLLYSLAVLVFVAMMVAPSILRFLIFCVALCGIIKLFFEREIAKEKATVTSHNTRLSQLDAHESVLREEAKKRIAQDKGMLFSNGDTVERPVVDSHLPTTEEPDTVHTVQPSLGVDAKPDEEMQ